MAHPAGGVISSIGDLLRFARMHMNGGEIDGVRVLSEESVRTMQEVQVEADTFHRFYGIGWHILTRPDATSIGHGGAWSGHRAHLTIIPEQNFAIALLTNSNVGARAYTEVEDWAVNHYLGITYPKPPRQEMSAEEMASFAGTFLRHDGRFELALHGDGLRLTVTDIDEETGEEEETPRLFDLEPVGETRFRVTSAESYEATIDILPVPDGDGNPRDLLRMGGRVAARAEG
jgi:CubicO group peptidase (beta-lactamase class C family)